MLVNHHGGGLFGFIADAFLGPDISKHGWEEREKFIDSHIRIYDIFQTGRPEDVIEVINFKDFFEPGSRDDRLWRAVAGLLGYDDVEAFLQNYFAHKTISQWDQTFNEEIAPRIFEALTENTITLEPFTTLDTTPTGKYHGGRRLIRMNFGARTSKTRREITEVRIRYSKTISYWADFWDHTTLNIEGLSIHYTTSHYDGYVVNTTVNTDLYDNVVSPYVVNAPMNSFPTSATRMTRTGISPAS